MKEILNYTLIQLDNLTIKVSSLIILFLFILLVYFFLRIIKKLINNTTKLDSAKKYSIFSLIKYCVIVFACIGVLQILGFNLSILLAGSAALLVGVGLGLQNLFSDFVSGIILLVNASVKVNDIIEVDQLVCKVQEITLRTTTVLTRDDKYIILPNTVLTRNQIINWTHSDIASRFEVNVGVDYSSDVKTVMNILRDIVGEQEGVLKNPSPFVRFTDFGESSLNFSVLFWAEEVFRVENIKSEIRVKIFEAFKLNNITIPFPQRVIHNKS